MYIMYGLSNLFSGDLELIMLPYLSQLVTTILYITEQIKVSWCNVDTPKLLRVQKYTSILIFADV